MIGILAAAAVAAATSAAAPGTSHAARPPSAELRVAMSDVVKNPEQALLLSRAYLASSSSLAPKSRARAEWIAGEALTRLNRQRDAIEALDAALRDIGDLNTKTRANILKARGFVEGERGDVEAAIRDLQAAFDLCREAHEARGQAVILEDIGGFYIRARDYGRALGYLSDALKLAPDDPNIQQLTRYNRALCLLALGRTEEAIHEYRQALIWSGKTHDVFLRFQILSGLTEAQIGLGQLAAAETTLRQAYGFMRLSPEISNKKPDFEVLQARIEAQRGDLRLAVRAVDRALKELSPRDASIQLVELHRTAAEIYSSAGLYEKAFGEAVAFKRADDSARDLAASTGAALLAARFDFARQERQIALLRAESAERRLELVRAKAAEAAQRTFLVVAFGLAALLLLGGWLGAALRSRAKIRAMNIELANSNSALQSALNAKAEFLARTSHEIRTPLNGMMGMSQVLLSQFPPGDPLRPKIELIQASGLKLNDLIDDILDVARVENGHIAVDRSEMKVSDLVDELLVRSRNGGVQTHVPITVDLNDAPDLILEDRKKVRQILSHLLGNAGKFTTKGEINIRVYTDSSEAGSWICYAIKDTGIGISLKEIDKIFEMFTQVDGGTSRRYGGAGLGLAVSRRLANALGGDLTVESVVGKGSEFTLRLPLRLANKVDDTCGGRSRTLVLEDNPISQGFLRATLKSKVESLQFATSWDEIQSGLDANPDIIVADYAFLARLDDDAPMGRLAAIRARTTGRMIVLAPAQSAVSLRADLEMHSDQVVAKPASPATICAAVSVYVEEKKSSQAAA